MPWGHSCSTSRCRASWAWRSSSTSSTSTVLPDWWQAVGPTGCREAGLVMTFDFRFSPNDYCFDPWSGRANGGIALYSVGYRGAAHRARLIAGGVLASPVELQSATEYYGFQLNVMHRLSVGPDACFGCGVGVCLKLTEIKAIQEDGSFERCMFALQDDVARWQCAHAIGGEGCYVTANCPTPAHPTSWGQIKSLYR